MSQASPRQKGGKHIEFTVSTTYIPATVQDEYSRMRSSQKRVVTQRSPEKEKKQSPKHSIIDASEPTDETKRPVQRSPTANLIKGPVLQSNILEEPESQTPTVVKKKGKKSNLSVREQGMAHISELSNQDSDY